MMKKLPYLSPSQILLLPGVAGCADLLFSLVRTAGRYEIALKQIANGATDAVMVAREALDNGRIGPTTPDTKRR